MRERFFTGHIQQFLAVSIGVLCLSAAVYLYSYNALRSAASENIIQFTENYVNKISEQLSWNDVYMEQSTVLSADYRTMFLQNDMALIDRTAELRVTYRLLKEVSMNEYNFFICDKSQGLFVELTSVSLPFSLYRDIKAVLAEQVTLQPANGTWTLLDTGGGRIITSLWTYGDFVLGGWIREEDLLAEMQTLDWGSGGICLLTDEELAAGAGTATGLGYRVLNYPIETSQTNFSLQVVLADNREMTQIMLIQLIQFVLALYVLIILVLLIRQVRRNLIIPVKQLTDILGKYQSTAETALPESSVREAVTDAYAVLDRLGEQMDLLTVKLYSSELEKKQLQLNFRNLQIRPHFFVNCLAMISGMAQVNAVDKIQQMAVCLSRYYRYILHDCMDMVPLRQEVEHIRDLIRVNEEWNSEALSFDCQLAEGVENLSIPVLSVSTFLENAVKHGGGMSGTLRIRLSADLVEEDRPYLRLQIADNGSGFSDEALRLLNEDPLSLEKDGRHVGISNVIQRLTLIYDKQARVRFSRSEMGGALVEIWIPTEKEQT